MARRPDPVRLYEARRAGLRSRLMAEARLNPETAERWLTAWEDRARAGSPSSPTARSWDGAWDWIAEQRRR